jgi:hypothetical protein
MTTAQKEEPIMNDAVSKKAAEQPNGPSRREFLTRAGLLAGGMALLSVPGFRPQSAAAATVDTRAFTGSTFALELDGQFIDFLKSVEGGFPKADVIQEPVGPNYIVKKHIGQPKYQDISIQSDPAMPKPLFDWIAAALTMVYARKNGAIITADFNRVEQSRLQFNNALITEFTISACDASAKDPAYLTIKFAPEFTTPLAGKGNILPGVGTKPKAWLPANFRLTIPGLDCSKVSKIEALTVKQAVVPQNIGEVRDLQKQPGKLEFPNLVMYVAESFAGTFYAWFQDMVIKGNAGDNNEKAGTLEFLDPTLKGSLLTIYFNHLGIFGFSPENSVANVDAVRRVKVEMYCEQMTLAPVKT